MRNKNFYLLVAFIILAILGVYFTFPVLQHIFNWPKENHDSGLTVAFIFLEREAMVRFSQIAFWSPAIHGGEQLFAQPYSIVFSPFFMFILLFGEIIGLKIYIVVNLVFGLWGMFLLARHFGCKRYSALIPPCIFLLSSIYPLQVAEGVYFYLTIAFIPWLMLFYLKSFKNHFYVYMSGLIAALILFSGGAYPVLFFALLFIGIYAVIESVSLKKFLPLKRYFELNVIFIAVGAVKLLPMASYMMHQNYLLGINQYNSLKVFIHSLFDRVQLLNIPRDKIWGLPFNASLWEFHGAYIGIIPCVIYLLALKQSFKKYRSVFLAGLVFLFFSISNIIFSNHPGPFGKYLLLLFHYPSRYKWMFIFSSALLIGAALSSVEERVFTKKNSYLAQGLFWAICFFIIFDLIAVNRPIFKEAFTRLPQTVIRQGKFQQTAFKNSGDMSKEYPILLKNQGLSMENCFDNKRVVICNAVPVQSNKYKGEIYALKGSVTQLEVIYFSPNVIKVKVYSPEDDVLIVNQNYDYNWHARGLDKARIVPMNGLLSVPLSAETSGILELYYLPGSFLIGFILSAICLISLLLLILHKISLNSNLSVLIIISVIAISWVVFEMRSPRESIPGFQTVFRALNYENNGSKDKALREFEKANTFFPNSVNIMNNIVRLRREIKYKDGLIEAIR